MVTVFILFILMLILLTTPARQALFFISEPIWRLENTIFGSKIVEYFKFKQSLIDEKVGLEQKLFLAGNLIAENEILQKENETLKDLLGRKEIKQKTILGVILVKPPQTPYDSIILDIGSDDNVKVGDKVVASTNIYIGEITEVYKSSSKVVLYSSPGQKLSVVLGENSVSAEAVGMGGGNFNINLPKEVEVKEGDVIVIPSITANVFGIVEKVNSQSKDSFQTVLFKSPVNINELNFVEIVLNK